MTNLDLLTAERQSTYGPWAKNMSGTSKQFAGLLENFVSCNPRSDLPAWWAPLCCVALKLNRIASGRFKQDNFDDLRVYLGMVEAMQREGAGPCAGTTPTPLT